MLLTVFFKSRSGGSNKEKSAGVADFFPCMWSSLAASHHAHFDTAAFFFFYRKMPSKQFYLFRGKKI